MTEVPTLQESQAVALLKLREKKGQLIEEFARLGTLTLAADSVGITRQTAYVWLRADDDMREKYQLAQEIIADGLEHKLEEVPDHAGGVTAKIFLLKGLRPWKYADRGVAVSKLELDKGLKLMKELVALGDDSTPAIEGESREINDGQGGSK